MMILKALEADVHNRKNLIGRDNPFKYMKGSQRWLEDQMYLEVEAPISVKYAEDTLL